MENAKTATTSEAEEVEAEAGAGPGAGVKVEHDTMKLLLLPLLLKKVRLQMMTWLRSPPPRRHAIPIPLHPPRLFRCLEQRFPLVHRPHYLLLRVALLWWDHWIR